MYDFRFALMSLSLSVFSMPFPPYMSGHFPLLASFELL